MGEGGGKDGRKLTFGRVGSFVFAEPFEVFVLHPGHIGVIVRVVFLTRPLHRLVYSIQSFLSFLLCEEDSGDGFVVLEWV